MFGHPGSLCTRRTMPANFAHKIPDTWSFEKSAGLIVVYATVIWCLAVVGALRNGQVSAREVEAVFVGQDGRC